MPIYCQARQWHLWLKAVPVRSQITIWTHLVRSRTSGSNGIVQLESHQGHPQVTHAQKDSERAEDVFHAA
eukprot:6203195-Pleurochrysis_carterae.AAC.1